MSFFNILFGSNADTEKHLNTLHQKIDQALPDKNDEEKLIISCIAGLFSRVAYADFTIDQREKINMQMALKEFCHFEDQTIELIADLALKNIVELSGLENHRYCNAINERWDNQKKYELLTALFSMAAADNSVDHIESEELRNICTGLLLEHKHFIAARAKVSQHLAALRKD